jgi:rhodanese-related sulfurtransferase
MIRIASVQEASQARGPRAAVILDVRNADGGMSAWRRAGLCVEFGRYEFVR